MATITGKALALVGRYTAFDPANPAATEAHQFQLVSESARGEDGQLTPTWAEGGYVLVGTAEITVEAMTAEETTANAVASLQQLKKKVQADAQRQLTAINQQLQGLLAITDGTPAWPSQFGVVDGDPDIPF